ncbi:Alpha/beta hydrolase fold-3 [Macleaya cordata]|uniref:Alpha/beta hydrolase fold-3 n=1 Tax=Macleaya cordata TaxID=56857 RepID=A0A200QXK6_MACCD|nr:Alpha/beta hydrolase fold-3 [Macleaya cordata]
MKGCKNEVVYEFPPFLRVYKDGREERLLVTKFVPPSIEDPKTSVSSKDVIIVPETGVSARLYFPKTTNYPQEQNKKLPLLIYFHGGAFCIESAFSPTYHNYLNLLVGEANVVALQGPESWFNDHVDFDRVFLAGISAGANISHNMAMRARIDHSAQLSSRVKFLGVVLVHPYFWGVEPIGSEENDMDKKVRMDKLWSIICPSTTMDCDDPLVNPATDPNFSSLGCNRVLICVAEKVLFRDRGWFYYETLRKSGWRGVVEIMESEGEDHVFHLFNPNSGKAVKMMKQLVSFLNQDKVPCRLCFLSFVMVF